MQITKVAISASNNEYKISTDSVEMEKETEKSYVDVNGKIYHKKNLKKISGKYHNNINSMIVILVIILTV